MGRKRHTPEQIITALREAEVGLARGKSVKLISRELGITELVAVGEYLRDRHLNLLHDAKVREHFHRGLFHGFDFDNTMLRIGSMNMLLHGVENPDIRYRDSLAQEHGGEEEKYTLVLANPPFAGSLRRWTVLGKQLAQRLQNIVRLKPASHHDRQALPAVLV